MPKMPKSFNVKVETLTRVGKVIIKYIHQPINTKYLYIARKNAENAEIFECTS